MYRPKFNNRVSYCPYLVGVVYHPCYRNQATDTYSTMQLLLLGGLKHGHCGMGLLVQRQTNNPTVPKVSRPSLSYVAGGMPGVCACHCLIIVGEITVDLIMV